MFIWGQAWLTLWSFTESPLFGVPLATLLENDQKLKPSTSIPLLLQEVRTLKNICVMCPEQHTYCLCILCSLYDVYDSNCWSHKLHKRLQIKIRKQAPCPLRLKHFDHTLFVAAVTEYNQQRWSRDSYLPMLNSADVFLSLSLCSCCHFWRRRESIRRGSCVFQDLSPESRYKSRVYTPHYCNK